jgi:hypothetical protein
MQNPSGKHRVPRALSSTLYLAEQRGATPPGTERYLVDSQNALFHLASFNAALR